MEVPSSTRTSTRSLLPNLERSNRCPNKALVIGPSTSPVGREVFFRFQSNWPGNMASKPALLTETVPKRLSHTCRMLAAGESGGNQININSEIISCYVRESIIPKPCFGWSYDVFGNDVLISKPRVSFRNISDHVKSCPWRSTWFCSDSKIVNFEFFVPCFESLSCQSSHSDSSRLCSFLTCHGFQINGESTNVKMLSVFHRSSEEVFANYAWLMLPPHRFLRASIIIKVNSPRPLRRHLSTVFVASAMAEKPLKKRLMSEQDRDVAKSHWYGIVRRLLKARAGPFSLRYQLWVFLQCGEAYRWEFRSRQQRWFLKPWLLPREFACTLRSQ